MKRKGNGITLLPAYFNPSFLQPSEIMCLQHINLSHKRSYLSTEYRNSTEIVALEQLILLLWVYNCPKHSQSQAHFFHANRATEIILK